MILELEDDGKIVINNYSDLVKWLKKLDTSKNSFAILSISEYEFIQTAKTDSGKYLIQYRNTADE